MSLLLQQDDCAPDSLEIFQRDFLIRTGMSTIYFMERAFCAQFYDGVLYRYNGYVLEWYCDNPYWELRSDEVHLGPNVVYKVDFWHKKLLYMRVDYEHT